MNNELLKDALELLYELKEHAAGDISDSVKERLDEVITKLEAGTTMDTTDKQHILYVLGPVLLSCAKISEVIIRMIDIFS